MPSKPVHYYEHQRLGYVIPVVSTIESTRSNPWVKAATFALTPLNAWIAYSLIYSFSIYSLPAVAPALSFIASPFVLAPSSLLQLRASAHVLSRLYDHHVKNILLKPCGTRIIVQTWEMKELDLPIAGIQSFQLVSHLGDSMLFYYDGETFLLGGKPWAKAIYNSELIRGVLLGMGVDLSNHPIHKQKSYLR